jgi:hypothetical protein
MAALQIDDAAELMPAPETAARIALPAVIAKLNRQRGSGRRALGATRSPRRRAEAARRLALAYRSAAERLRPLAAGDARCLIAALGGLARDHRELAAASRRRDVRTARRAGAAIEREERRLGSLLEAVTTSG